MDKVIPADTIPARLIEKYSVSAPRYTSYPTAAEFSDEVGSAVWERCLRDTFNKAQIKPLSLYIHIPFCHNLCYFCACHKIIPKERSIVGPYLEAIKQELFYYQSLIGADHQIAQLHWGGGTPNYLNSKEMETLSDLIRHAFPHSSPLFEFSVEVDPRTATEETLSTLRAVGCNRVSFGIQDLDPIVQNAIHRVQSFAKICSLFEKARQLGFRGINVDLIYGLPQQTNKTFQATINNVITLRPERIALYGYAHLPGSRKVQRSFHKLPLPTAKERLRIFHEAIQQLLAAGYVHIGMDHFALPGDDLAIALKTLTLRRNFMGYTSSESDLLLGFGPSAISALPSCFAQNEKDLGSYFEKVKGNGAAITRGKLRSLEDRRRAFIIGELFCQGRIAFSNFEDVWQTSFQHAFRQEYAELRTLISDGLLSERRDGFYLTGRGRLFVRNVAMVFDSYIEKYQLETTAIFSSAV